MPGKVDKMPGTVDTFPVTTAVRTVTARRTTPVPAGESIQRAVRGGNETVRTPLVAEKAASSGMETAVSVGGDGTPEVAEGLRGRRLAPATASPAFASVRTHRHSSSTDERSLPASMWT
jgi:hypothetical protein